MFLRMLVAVGCSGLLGDNLPSSGEGLAACTATGRTNRIVPPSSERAIPLAPSTFHERKSLNLNKQLALAFAGGAFGIVPSFAQRPITSATCTLHNHLGWRDLLDDRNYVGHSVLASSYHPTGDYTRSVFSCSPAAWAGTKPAWTPDTCLTHNRRLRSLLIPEPRRRLAGHAIQVVNAAACLRLWIDNGVITANALLY
jgi:hypothetical protein